MTSAAASTEQRTKTLYLIDGHAQFFRAYHAIRTGMTSSVTGEPTNMTYGFVGMLIKLLRDYRPDYLVVAIDVSGDRETFRSELYPEYKANREAAPDDLGPQIDRCLALLESMRVPVLGVAGVEADDVIATLVRRLRREHEGLNIRIVSRDKDLTQLLDSRVELFDVHKDEAVTPDKVFKTEGVEPRHVVDILALMGDSVDNVPGVPGIGPKTAAKLVLEYGSLDALMEHLDAIKGKRRENLEAARDQLPLSRQLVLLRDDVEVDFELEAARIDFRDWPVEDLLAAFRELDFNMHRGALRKLVGGEAGGEPEAPAADDSAARASTGRTHDDREFLFASMEAPNTPATRSTDVELVTTVEALDAVVARARAAGVCAIDTETDDILPMRAGLCGVSLSAAPGEGAYIPVRSPDPSTHLDTATVLARLRPLVDDASVQLIGHNIKYDMIVLRRHGLDLSGRANLFDTMVASYVVDATRSSHKLDTLALALLEHHAIPIDEVIGSGRRQKTFETVPLDQAAEYAAEDADVALRLSTVLTEQLESAGLRRLFDELEMPLVHVLAELEYNGIRVDPDELDVQRRELSDRIEELRTRISSAAPHPFNPDSPKQLAQALFNRPDQEPPGLGLKVLKRGKTGPSTDQEVLEKIAGDPDVTSPVPGLILEHRHLVKLVNTYLVALKEAIHPETGRVHASFNQTVAATGRLSSSDPNLQNIPIRTEVGRQVRRAFVAAPGHLLITADYSQIELRLLAHLSQDPNLIEAFRAGEDIHRTVAAEVFGVAPDEVTATQRNSAKMVNFGIVYGITAFGLARRLGGEVSRGEAQQVIDDYKTRFSGIDAFLRECIASAEDRGWVETMLGRRRAIPQINMRHPQQRALGERMAINTVVQGSAADLIKLAMIDLYGALPERFRRGGVRMLLQIHDELVFETPDAADGDAADPADVQAFIVDRMEHAMELAVPLVVDAARSTTWIDAK